MIAEQEKQAIDRLESRKLMRPMVGKMYIEGMRDFLGMME